MNPPSSPLPLVIAVEISDNRKTGPVSTTYVAQQSCPSTCPLKDQGCYAEVGPTGIHTKRINKAAAEVPARQRTPLALAKLEAAAIGRLRAERPMRLHVVGDAKTESAVRVLAEAAKKYTQRAGNVLHRGGAPFGLGVVFRRAIAWARRRRQGVKIVWTYTHAWRKVEREIWGKAISVLASCETVEQMVEARRSGYAPALVVEKHAESGRAWRWWESANAPPSKRWTIIPCPAQTKENITCTQCQLCWRDDWLFESRTAIAFEAHGSRTKTVQQVVRKESELIQIKERG